MRRSTFRIYEDRRYEWRWRLVASNGRIIADSGEGYTRRHDAIHSVYRLRTIIASDAVIVEVGR